jgi:hypothetical protein
MNGEMSGSVYKISFVCVSTGMELRCDVQSTYKPLFLRGVERGKRTWKKLAVEMNGC